jgi:hypothetical protein
MSGTFRRLFLRPYSLYRPETWRGDVGAIPLRQNSHPVTAHAEGGVAAGVHFFAYEEKGQKRRLIF